MKRTKLLIGLWMTVILMISLCGCGHRMSERDKMIESTIKEFEYACQNLDQESMLNCIDPAVAENLKLAIQIYSIIHKTDSEDFMDVVVSDLFGEEYDPRQYLKGLSFEDIEIKSDKTQAQADCTIQILIEGENLKKSAVIYLKLIKDKWCISDVSFK